MPRLGAAPPCTISPGSRVAYIQQAEASGYEGIWVPRSDGHRCLPVLAAATQVTRRLRLGTGIVPIYTRTPTTLAMTIATLDALSGGRAVLGLGVSSEIIIGAWHGLPFPNPWAPCVRPLILSAVCCERVTAEGTCFRGAQSASQCALSSDRTIPIYIGALNPGMLRLAGAIADGVILNWMPAAHVPRAIEAIAAGASALGVPWRTSTSLAISGSVSPMIWRPPAVDAPGTHRLCHCRSLPRLLYRLWLWR